MATQPLLSGPSTEFAAASNIERGEPVERLAVLADYSLVRDDSGRVGYVKAANLGLAAPPVGTDEPFARCQRRPLEPDTTACEQRGRQQLESCRTSCKTPGCAEQCSTRFADCRLACTQPAAPPSSPGSASAPPSPAGATSAPAPTSPTPAVVPGDSAPTDEAKPEAVRKGKKAKGKKARAAGKRKAKAKGPL